MKLIESEFETNANGCGLHTFKLVKRGVTPTGKPVCLYQRIYATKKNFGKVFGYEVFVPSVKKAGTYPLPLPKGSPEGTPNPTITYDEDSEEYPGAAKFGKSAWSYPAYQAGGAEWKFQQLTKEATEFEDTDEVDESKSIEAGETNEVKHHRYSKVDRPQLMVPKGEFSTKELCELNKVEYPVAAFFLKHEEAEGKIKRTRTERRNVKGKETQLFQRITVDTSS